MRAVFVLAGLGAGGAERVVSLITSDWADNGSDVVIVTFDSPAEPIYHHFDPRITLIRLGLPIRTGKRRDRFLPLRRLLALRRALRQLSPGIVVSFLTKVNALVLLASMGVGCPVVVSERNNAKQQSRAAAWDLLLLALYRRASAVILQTEASRQHLPAAVRQRALVIPNPVVVATTAAEPTAERTLVAVGRLDRQKGFDLLLGAFAKAASDHRDWTLTIWGDGPARRDLEAQRDDLGLSGRVALPGNSAAPGCWTRSAAMFVLPSRFEGFPNVLGEAMAAGLPVAAFDCDFGPREMIAHGVDGLLIENGNVDALAAALDTLMSDDRLRRQLGSAAQASIRRFDAATVLQQWRSMQMRIVADHAGSA